MQSTQCRTATVIRPSLVIQGGSGSGIDSTSNRVKKACTRRSLTVADLARTWIVILYSRICNPYPVLLLLASFVQQVPKYVYIAIQSDMKVEGAVMELLELQTHIRTARCNLNGLAEQLIFFAL